MKPRLKMGDMYVHVAGCQLAGWWCEGDGVREWGPTLEYAYRKWRMKSIFRRLDQAYMQQYVYPQKPTWLQSWWRHGLAGILAGRR